MNLAGYRELAHEPEPVHRDHGDAVVVAGSAGGAEGRDVDPCLAHELNLGLLKVLQRFFIAEEDDHAEVLGPGLDTGRELPVVAAPDHGVVGNDNTFAVGAAEAEPDPRD